MFALQLEWDGFQYPGLEDTLHVFQSEIIS